ncbi:ribosome maturation factor RimM [Pseudodesulfovibrio tunisiensis]|uniref:ribosome maturation factor RimM n=1 Tax=Pseudodesulfovibrio tunisiensis TaxID=463192 RepID=UPI001FB38129|nr:ribosome maturation factor RimM [Pseudodesulfovibrio tunisiensis]
MAASHAADPFICVGEVVKPHGIRGEFCILCHADSPTFFDGLDTIFLRSGKARPRAYETESWRRHNSRVLLKLRGVDDRDRAEALRGMELLVRKSVLPEIDESVYLYELDGCAVLLEDGSPVGEFQGFIEAGGQEVWIIRSTEGREILLPAVPEFVLDIDPDERRIVIAPPEGLLDLYAEEQTDPRDETQARPRTVTKAGPKSRSGAASRERSRSKKPSAPKRSPRK